MSCFSVSHARSFAGKLGSCLVLRRLRTDGTLCSHCCRHRYNSMLWMQYCMLCLGHSFLPCLVTSKSPELEHHLRQRCSLRARILPTSSLSLRCASEASACACVSSHAWGLSLWADDDLHILQIFELPNQVSVLTADSDSDSKE